MDRRRASGEPLSGLAATVRGESLRAGFVPVLAVMVVVVAVTAVLDLRLASGAAQRLLPVLWTGLGLAFLVAALAVGAGRVSLRRLPDVTGTLVVLHSAVTVAALAVGQDRERILSVIFAVVVAGGVLTGIRWMLANDVVCLGGVLAVLSADGAGIYDDLLSPVAYTLVIAHLIHALRLRGLQQVERLTAELASQAGTDALTGLLNRRGLEAAGRRFVDVEVGVLWLDLDGFKRINDELGHAAGDAVLVEAADRLRHLVRGEDVVARAGGDEFVVLLPAVDAEALDRTAVRVGMQLAGTVGVLQIPWAVSVGVARGRVSGPGSLQDLLRRADLAMYTQKQQRKEAATIRR
jgi:diguanylate cyclase (GGDEF)-like protein